MLKRDGFTLIELLIVMVVIVMLIVGAYFVCISAVCRGNFWYTNGSVLRELKADHPNVTEVLKTKRCVFAKSVITVKEDGANRDYYLDTNVLWNYEFLESK